jgi:hypothetical protein
VAGQYKVGEPVLDPLPLPPSLDRSIRMRTRWVNRPDRPGATAIRAKMGSARIVTTESDITQR